MFIPHREVWKRQPQVAVGIDWSNSITSNLFDAWSASDGWISATKLHPLSIPSSVLNTVNRDGKTALLPNSASMNCTLRRSFNSGSAGRSVLVLCEVPQSGLDSYDVVASFDTGAATAARIQVSSNAAQWAAYDGANVLDGGVVVPGKRTCVVGTFGGPGSSCYVDGKLVASQGLNSTALTATSLYVGGYGGQDAAWWSGTISLVVAFNRVLSATEVASISGNPWQIFAP